MKEEKQKKEEKKEDNSTPKEPPGDKAKRMKEILRHQSEQQRALQQSTSSTQASSKSDTSFEMKSCVVCKRKTDEETTKLSCGCNIHIVRCLGKRELSNRNDICPKHRNIVSPRHMAKKTEPVFSTQSTPPSTQSAKIVSTYQGGNPTGRVSKRKQQLQKARNSSSSRPPSSQSSAAESLPEEKPFPEPKPPKDICDRCGNFVHYRGTKPKKCKEEHRMHVNCLKEQK